MAAPEEIEMEIKIADQKVRQRVAFDRQDFVRETEKEIGNLFWSLRKSFPKKKESELLAMIIYQYASYYRDLVALHKKALQIAIQCDNMLTHPEVDAPADRVQD